MSNPLIPSQGKKGLTKYAEKQIINYTQTAGCNCKTTKYTYMVGGADEMDKAMVLMLRLISVCVNES